MSRLPLKHCRNCGQVECECVLSLTDVCGNCGEPVAFIEHLAAFRHRAESCSEINVDHLLVGNQA